MCSSEGWQRRVGQLDESAWAATICVPDPQVPANSFRSFGDRKKDVVGRYGKYVV
jgi:hypothetical protein